MLRVYEVSVGILERKTGTMICMLRLPLETLVRQQYNNHVAENWTGQDDAQIVTFLIKKERKSPDDRRRTPNVLGTLATVPKPTQISMFNAHSSGGKFDGASARRRYRLLVWYRRRSGPGDVGFTRHHQHHSHLSGQEQAALS